MAVRAQLDVQVNRERLLALGHPGGPVYAHWLKVLMRIDARAKENLSGSMVKVRTGNLRSSQSVPVVLVVGTTIVGISQNTASYAAAVHDGTRPHPILPVRARVLRFTPAAADAPVFAVAVMHPGTQPKPFLREAMHEVLRLGV